MKILSCSVFENAEDFERARIPGIVCTKSNTLIAYCELRRSDSDWAVIDIGMKRSTEGDFSRSERKILLSGKGQDTVNNPVMIADGDTLHFLFCINYHRVYYMKSTDEGNTWTAPHEITSQIKESLGGFFFSCVATGPTHGIVTSSGRLMVPMWLAFNKDDNKSHHPSVIAVLYSDDKGKTWKTGSIYDKLRDPSEFALAQASDGRIYANIRHEEEKRCRILARLSDDCEFTDVHFCDTLPDPVCCAGFCSVGDDLLFSNCADTRERRHLTLKRIDADGNVKEELYICEAAGYSDIAVSPDGKTAYILHENGKKLLLTEIKL